MIIALLQLHQRPKSLLLLVISLLIQPFTWPSQSEGADYALIENVPYRDKSSEGWDDYMDKRCRLDLYYPEQSKGFATVVWFHGGGLRGGKKSIPPALKNQGIAVIAANYRLFPKVKCPAYIEDATAAVAWTFRNITKYGGNADQIFISGHSAGGYLTSMVGLDKNYLAAHDIDANRIAGLVPLSGHTITHFTPREEKGIPGEQPIIDRFAPLYHVRRDAPALILITGDRELELLGRYEENAYLARMMKVAKHTHTKLYELDGFNHGTMRDPALKLLLQVIKNHHRSPPLP
ncbi:MAG: alpha/beta hydrolase [Verrucomicrobiaceae bacterium]|nr:alpha/beta hydrolase [Verrucomicrobiaceae bacterium]